jgi:transposase-like protein
MLIFLLYICNVRDSDEEQNFHFQLLRCLRNFQCVLKRDAYLFLKIHNYKEIELSRGITKMNFSTCTRHIVSLRVIKSTTIRLMIHVVGIKGMRNECRIYAGEHKWK